MKKMQVNVKLGSNSYPIILGPGLLNTSKILFKKYIPKCKKILIVTDKGTPDKYRKTLLSNLKNFKVTTIVFRSGEETKNLKNIDKLLAILFKQKLSRDDCIIALGGGVVGDLSGFAASIFKRGIHFIQIPTTLLAQVDSSIGGKTGVNAREGKNMIGSFYQPRFVLIDPDTLNSLSVRDLFSGFAEVLKYGLIMNKNFFEWLEKNAYEMLFTRDIKLLTYAIKESCKCKALVVEKDEKEKNLRAILNFGHTFAHAFESAQNYSKDLTHGEAVLIGMFIASHLSKKLGLLKEKELTRIVDLYNELNLHSELDYFFTEKDIPKLLGFMRQDKKIVGGKIKLVLLARIGKAMLKQSDLNTHVKKILQDHFRGF